MTKETVAEQLQEFWQELDNVKSKNILDKWVTDDVYDLSTIIEQMFPELDLIEEFILNLSYIEYNNITLQKNVVINGLPNINDYKKEGDDYKLNSFYKELRDTLWEAPKEQFTFGFVIQSIFAHFVSKYNENIISHNKNMEEVDEYIKKVNQYTETTRHIMEMLNLFKSQEERNTEWFSQVFGHLHTESEEDADYPKFVYIAKQMNEKNIYKIGMSTDINQRERHFV